MNALVKPLENLYAQVPNLPAAWREALVKITPWLALVFGVLAVLFGLMGILGAGALTAVTPFAGPQVGTFTALVWVGVIILLVQGVLLLVAFPSLKKRLLKGWNILFLIELVWILGGILDLLAFNLGSLLSTILGAAIGFYILFQIKSYYK